MRSSSIVRKGSANSQMVSSSPAFLFFFFNDTAPPEIYTLPLHDALPISLFTAGLLGLLAALASVGVIVFALTSKRLATPVKLLLGVIGVGMFLTLMTPSSSFTGVARSEEHTSELQSHSDLVCRLLLAKQK